MCMSRPSLPPIAPPPAVATEQDASVQAALDSERRRRAAMNGRTSTLINGPQGITTPPSFAAPKTLLGG